MRERISDESQHAVRIMQSLMAAEVDTGNFKNATTVPDQSTLGYNWSFGDNSMVSHATDASHVYAVSGSYIIQLQATSAWGCTSSATKTAAHKTATGTEKAADKTADVSKTTAKKTGTGVKKGATSVGHVFKKKDDKPADKPEDKPQQ